MALWRESAHRDGYARVHSVVVTPAATYDAAVMAASLHGQKRVETGPPSVRSGNGKRRYGGTWRVFRKSTTKRSSPVRMSLSIGKATVLGPSMSLDRAAGPFVCRIALRTTSTSELVVSNTGTNPDAREGVEF